MKSDESFELKSNKVGSSENKSDIQADIDESVNVRNSEIGDNSYVREHCTVHESEIGKGCRIYERVLLKRVEIANNVDINAGTYIENAKVEDNVLIAPNCSIVGVTHEITKDGAKRADTFEKVIVRKGVFIGANSVVLPGVEIGQGSVIGAGTTVTKNVPPGHICFGAPQNQIMMSLEKWLKTNK